MTTRSPHGPGSPCANRSVKGPNLGWMADTHTYIHTYTRRRAHATYSSTVRLHGTSNVSRTDNGNSTDSRNCDRRPRAAVGWLRPTASGSARAAASEYQRRAALGPWVWRLRPHGMCVARHCAPCVRARSPAPSARVLGEPYGLMELRPPHTHTRHTLSLSGKPAVSSRSPSLPWVTACEQV